MTMCFTEEETQMANRHVKRHSLFLVIQGDTCQSHNFIPFHTHQIGKNVKSLTMTIQSADEEYEFSYPWVRL